MDPRDLNYKICVLRTKVWLRPIYHGRYLPKEFLDEVDDYVRVANIGVRTADDRWKLTCKKALTMFLMRWQ
jgi:hypothetical protein